MKVVPALLILFILCLLPLIFGMESVLLAVLPGGIPLGTLLAAMAFISASSIPVFQNETGSSLRRVGWVLLLASILWLPFGIYLSGSRALNFVQDAGDAQLFWRFTGSLGICILILLTWTGVHYIHERRKDSSVQ